jgi:hypothetical protein
MCELCAREPDAATPNLRPASADLQSCDSRLSRMQRTEPRGSLLTALYLHGPMPEGRLPSGGAA